MPAAAVAALSCWLAVALAAPAPAGAQAPDPGGNESADLVGPPAGKLFGFSGIRQYGDPDPATAAALIGGIRGNASRTGMHWQALEPERDQYRAFPQYDRLYNALRAQDIDPIFVIQFAPAWAREPGKPRECGKWDGCHYPPARTAEMLGEWAEFVGDVARRYPRATIEVWNEPNFGGQWQSGVDPEHYAELLAEADEAVRSVDGAGAPGRVLAGGLGTTPKPNSLTATEFLHRAYAASPSLKGNTRAINFHLYPGESIGAGSSFAEIFAGIRAVRAEHRDGGTPLLVTETGATTSGPGGLSERQQADLVLRVARKILTMPDTAGVLLYTLADRSELAPEDPEHGFGVVSASSGLLSSEIDPKHSYCTLRLAARRAYSRCPLGTRIDRAPPEVVTTDQVEIRFSAPGALRPSFACALDGAGYRPCTSPKRYGPLAEGRHTISVRVRDALGRTDPHPPIEDFVVDRRDNNRLQLKVQPKRPRARAGGKQRLKIKVRARGTPIGVERAKVCAKPKKRRLTRGGRRCKEIGPIAAGEQATSKLSVKLRRRARGKRIPVRLVARAPSADKAVARAKIRVRR